MLNAMIDAGLASLIRKTSECRSTRNIASKGVGILSSARFESHVKDFQESAPTVTFHPESNHPKISSPYPTIFAIYF